MKMKPYSRTPACFRALFSIIQRCCTQAAHATPPVITATPSAKYHQAKRPCGSKTPGTRRVCQGGEGKGSVDMKMVNGWSRLPVRLEMCEKAGFHPAGACLHDCALKH